MNKEIHNRIVKHSIAAGMVFIAIFLVALNMDISKRNNRLTYIYNEAVKSMNGIYHIQSQEKEDIKNIILNTTEDTQRNQMRLNLEAVGRKIEDKINNENFSKLDTYSLIKKISTMVYEDTVYQRTYNSEGDWFALLTIGGYTYFLVDESDDCGEPRIGKRKLLNISNRTRSMYDEVVWQEELKYVLACANLIPMPKYMKGYNPAEISINKYLMNDEKLSNVEIFRYRDLQYIESTYPDLYNKIKSLKIVMHSRPELAEKFMNFISFNRASVDNDKLFWYFNDYPRKEILEVYVVPAGVYGFFKTARTTGAGVFNDNYIKVTLVAGAQLYDYQTNKWTPVMHKMDRLVDDSKVFRDSFLESLNKEKKQIISENNRNSVLMSVIFIICLIFSIYSYSRIPEYMPKEYVEKHFCKACKKEEDS